jgi:hypothetical protein
MQILLTSYIGQFGSGQPQVAIMVARMGVRLGVLTEALVDRTEAQADHTEAQTDHMEI